MYSVGIYRSFSCKSRVNGVDIKEAAVFLSSFRSKTERVLVKLHEADGTSRYINYKTFRQRIDEYLKQMKLEYHDLLEQVGK